MDLTERILGQLRTRLKDKFAVGDMDLLLAWLREATATKPVLFTGAGVTLGAQAVGGGDPTKRPALWWDLETQMRSELGSLSPDEGVSPLWLAQVYENAFGKHRLLQLLEREVPDARLEPGPLHRALALSPWEAVITTNYDSLLERAYDPAAVCVVNSDGQLARSRRQGCLEVLHPHGSFADPQNLVFTLESYRTFVSGRPGMLAKIKQLLLQHPVLFVGFSANDPNFVEWSGWVRDVALGNQPLWLSLDVAKSRRGEYVARIFPGMRFFHVPLDAASTQLTEVALEIAQVLRPGSRHWGDIVVSDIDLAPSADAVLAAVETAVREKQRDPLSNVSLSHLFDRAFRRLVRLSNPDDGENHVSALFNILPPGDSRTNGLNVLRRSAGKHWRRYLELIVETMGVQHRIGNVLVDAREEPVIQDVRAVDVARRLESLDQTSLSDLEQLDKELASPMNHFEQTALSRVRLAILRRGVVRQAREGARTAAELRHFGYTAVLAGDYKAASSAYERAAWGSKSEDEPVWLQSLTADSALQTRRMLSIDPRKIPTLDPTLEEHQRQLQLTPAVVSWRGHYRRAIRDALDTLRDAEIAGVQWSGAPHVSALRIVDVMEVNWVAPALIKPIAVTAAQAMLYGSEFSRAVDLMVRYDEQKSLKTNLRRMVRRPGPADVKPVLVDALCSGSVSTSEQSAKAAGLLELVSELREIPPVLSAAMSGLEVPRHDRTVGGSFVADQTDVFFRLVEALAAHYGIRKVGVEAVSKLTPDARHNYGLHLPWAKWLRDGDVDFEYVEKWWGRVPSQYRPQLLELGLAVRKFSQTKSEFFEDALAALTSEPPSVDDLAWLRAAAVAAQGEALGEHLRQLSVLLAQTRLSGASNFAVLAFTEKVELASEELVQKVINRSQTVVEAAKNTDLEYHLDELAAYVRFLAARWLERPTEVETELVGLTGRHSRLLFHAVSTAPTLVQKCASVRDGVRQSLVGSMTSESPLEQQKAGLAAVARSQKVNIGSTWWLADAIALTGSPNPEVVQMAIDVLSNTHGSANYGELAVAALNRLVQDGRATVLARLVPALRRWSLSYPQAVEVSLAALMTDPRELVKAAFAEAEVEQTTTSDDAA